MDLLSELFELYNQNLTDFDSHAFARSNFRDRLRMKLSEDFSSIESTLLYLKRQLSEWENEKFDINITDDLKALTKNGEYFKIVEMFEKKIISKEKYKALIFLTTIWRFRFHIDICYQEITNGLMAKELKLNLSKKDFLWCVYIILVESGAKFGKSKVGRLSQNTTSDKNLYGEVCRAIINKEDITKLKLAQLGSIDIRKLSKEIRRFVHTNHIPTSISPSYHEDIFKPYEGIPKGETLQSIMKSLEGTASYYSKFFTDTKTYISKANNL